MKLQTSTLNLVDQKSYTPMMQHYLEVKSLYPDMFVFYRMGDFYELFFNDAVDASSLLGITLTSRGQVAGNPIKMAGMPFHSVSQYITKLVKLGKSIVIVDQVGEVTGKAPVERRVTKIITPGTLTDEALLEEKLDNTITCLYKSKNNFGLATISLASGKFYINQINEKDLIDHLERLDSAEFIVAQSLFTAIKKLKPNHAIKSIEDWHFDYDANYKKICEHFIVKDLSGFGINKPSLLNLGITAAGILLNYVKQNQNSNLPHITSIQYDNHSNFLILDAISRRNLEINLTINGEKSPTLLSIFDKCSTAIGSRLLRLWLNNPLKDHNEINKRLETVEKLCKISKNLHNILVDVCDIERIISRIALRSARPRDLSALSETLTLLPQIISLSYISSSNNNDLLSIIFESIKTIPPEINNKLIAAIKKEPSNWLREGNIFNDGYNVELDHLRNIKSNGAQFLLDMEDKEKKRTQINNLKIEFNKIHGYFIEITNSNLDKVPVDYRRTQTLKNAERYTTPELKKFEMEIISAKDKAIEIEKKLYDEILNFLNQYISPLQNLCKSIATLDVLNNFAKISQENNFNRPNLVSDSIINIKNGRHAVIEKQVEQFIANDISLDSNNKFLLITGPNMGGKSTYMRQTALIILLAYCGSFIPAESATIGPIDRIFTRIGASDDLSGGKSTFMVEMTESANILNNATANSLVLMDEVGRGTSTFDGLALAYAISKYLIEKIHCYSLFATHYLELTELAKESNLVKNIHLSATEYHDKIIFLHRINEGAAEKSYGIQVASLAGVPKSIINLAKKHLQQLEKKQTAPIDLFSSTLENENIIHATLNEQEINVIKQLKNINPDELNAKEALELIYNLNTQLLS